MNILSIDTSTAILSIALKTGSTYEERMVNGAFSPSENLMGEIKAMLTRASVKLGDIDLLITTRGPGSFTGLRIAMSLLKGISLSNDIPLVSVPTLSVIEKSSSLYNGTVLSVIDAKKKRFYYRISNKEEDRDESPETIVNEIKALSSPVLVTGPDALTFYKKAKEIDESINLVLDEGAPRNLSHALISLGEEQYKTLGADDIGMGPVYIRRSDAEEMLLARTAEAHNGN